MVGDRHYAVKIVLAASIALAAIVLATGFAMRSFPPAASSIESKRNPYRFRDWANYINAIDVKSDAARVVLLSNSQAYSGEYSVNRGYPSRLEGLLNERKTAGYERWEVLNLSVDGITPMEYMALAARLRNERPTWLIFISGSADFRAENAGKGFLFSRTDIPYLLTELPIARRLPFRF